MTSVTFLFCRWGFGTWGTRAISVIFTLDLVAVFPYEPKLFNSLFCILLFICNALRAVKRSCFICARLAVHTLLDYYVWLHTGLCISFVNVLFRFRYAQCMQCTIQYMYTTSLSAGASVIVLHKLRTDAVSAMAPYV